VVTPFRDALCMQRIPAKLTSSRSHVNEIAIPERRTTTGPVETQRGGRRHRNLPRNNGWDSSWFCAGGVCCPIGVAERVRGPGVYSFRSY